MSIVVHARVTSRGAPPVALRCHACHRVETFRPTERLRANSSGRLVEIWLLYRCDRCGSATKVPVVDRVRPERLPAGLLAAAQANDPAVARRLARDVGLLRRAGARLAGPDEWSVEAVRCDGADVLVLDVPEPLVVRLDAVVAAATGMPRSAARALVPSTRLRCWPTTAVELRT